MKQVYTDLAYQQQVNVAGLWKLQITPREWLASDPVIDFETGKVLEAITLKEDKFWLALQLTPQSYDYAETPKTAKSGDYYEIAMTGALNTCNYAVQQVLETIRRQEQVAILTDRNKRSKVIGTTVSGMKLAITHTHKNAPLGEERLLLDLTYVTEDPPPYYNPDNTPDISLGNFLIDSTGNFLLVE